MLGHVAVTGLDLRALGSNAKLFDGVKDIPIVASASTEFRVESGGKLSFAAFDITAHGEVPYAAMKTKALHINNLRLVGRYDGVSRHLALSTADLDARKQWDDYSDAYEVALGATSTEKAPWYIIPADSKTHRNLMIADLIVRSLDSLKLAYPPAKESLKGIKVE